jgi:hypothetical protein
MACLSPATVFTVTLLFTVVPAAAGAAPPIAHALVVPACVPAQS